MNIYSSIFAASWAFETFDGAKKREKLEQSVVILPRLRWTASSIRAGDGVLLCFDRACWTGKSKKRIYRRWLVGKLNQPLVDNANRWKREEKSKLKMQILKESS